MGATLPVLARHAVRLNGLDSLAVTKLDVLTGMKKIRVCVAYQCEGKRIEEVPASPRLLGRVRPVYEDLPGWDEPLHQARSLGDLPANARRYVKVLEELTGTPVNLVSVGARRSDTIHLRSGSND